jgi:hypothetical protein
MGSNNAFVISLHRGWTMLYVTGASSPLGWRAVILFRLCGRQVLIEVTACFVDERALGPKIVIAGKSQDGVAILRPNQHKMEARYVVPAC